MNLAVLAPDAHRPTPTDPPSSMYYAPWQNNFFVAAVNWAVELGFNSPNALSLRNWFNKWPTGLMGQDNSGYCPYYAGAYNLNSCVELCFFW